MPPGHEEEVGMDHPRSRSRSPVVRQLVNLPIFDRVKVVKDLMLGQLDSIHAHLLAVQNVADALLANDSPLLESSITLVGAVHDARLAVDRQGQLVLDTLQQTRQDLFGQTREILNLLRQRGDELNQQEHSLLDAVTAGQKKAERQADNLRDAVQASAQETREQHLAFLEGARQARQDAQRHAQGVLDTLRRIREETGEQEQRLLETLSTRRQDDERQMAVLFDAIRGTRAETREQAQGLVEHVHHAQTEARREAEKLLDLLQGVRDEAREQEQRLLETLSTRQQDDEHQMEMLLSAVRSTRAETREQTQDLIDQIHRAQDDAQSQTQELLDLVRSVREETQAQTRALLADVSQARHDAQRHAREILDDRQRIQEEADHKSNLLLALLRNSDDALREQSHRLLEAIDETTRRVVQSGDQIESVLGKLQAVVNDDRQLLHAALERIRFRSALVKSGQAKVVPLRGGYPEEPETGLMAHLYSHVPSRIAVDIGANVGDVSHQLLTAGYEVFAFEPHAEVFQQLRERFSAHPAFHGFSLALGSADETRSLHLAADQSGCNRYRDSTLYSSLLHHAMPDDLVFTETVPVTVRTLASLHAAGHLPTNVGVVKIDTEGFDLEVIRGMDSHRYPVVVAEYWDQDMPFGKSGAANRLDDLVKEMRSRDYHWYIVFYRVWGKHGTSFYCNHEHSVTGAFGNVFFFRDHAIFGEALKWCAAVLPVTYLGG
jgi:FkbM family methyltransferase